MLAVSAESWQVGSTKIFIKTDMNEKLEILLSLRFSSAVRTIQRFWQWARANLKTIIIQKYSRRFVKRKQFRRACHSFLRIQSLFRGRRLLALFRKTRAFMIAIQKIARGKIGRRIARALKNPLNKMTYGELSDAIDAAETELQTAISTQQFELCDEIQARIKDLAAARKKLPPPEPVPTCRRDLDLLLLETNFALTSAKSAEPADSADIATLSARKARLLSLYPAFPVVEEIEEELLQTRADLEKSMAKKEFRKCGELQAKVKELSSMLERLTKEGVYKHALPLESLAEKLAVLEASLAASLQQSDFDKCDIIQADIDAIKVQIDRVSISESDLEVKLKKLYSEFEEARGLSNFRRMAMSRHSILELEVFKDKFEQKRKAEFRGFKIAATKVH
jgi:myosin heavy subunit